MIKVKDYDCECIFYLGLQIEKMLSLGEKWLLIDEYYNAIKEIYEDYKKYDNKNKSLLDSINDYIYDNRTFIGEKIEKSFDME